MSLSKEFILTLSCLKDVEVKGIGPKKVLAIGLQAGNNGVEVRTTEDLYRVMQSMKEKVILNVDLADLNDAYAYALRLIQKSEDNGIGLIGYFDDIFPESLRKAINEEGKADSPMLLWYRGDLSLLQMPGIAVIGTREATPEGMAGGEFLSGEFAKKGFNIVSGLAIGCDTCGHKGALKVGGSTTAFLANGLDHDSIYPPENQDLAEEIVEKGGLLLSEYRIGSIVNRYSLVARDRLQAGLAQATLVVMTGVKGGTMHAANTTLKAGKPLFVMKFKNDYTNQHEKCLGNAYLVQQGAKYISGEDMKNLDPICDGIKKRQSFKTELF